MQKACLAIGIGITDGLAELPGAINAATDFSEWAKACNYKTILVTDAKPNNPVTVDRVREALLQLLPKPKRGHDSGGPMNPPDRLIIFFAGHGLIRGAGEDLWLMGDSFHSQRAISVQALLRKLMSYIIYRGAQQQPIHPQIAVISDACQIAGRSNQSYDLVPDAVLPLGPFDPSQSMALQVETLKAVPELKEAFMLPEHDGVPARCIFSYVLLDALLGAVRDNQGRCLNIDLSDYLESNVPKKAEKYKVEMFPQCSPSWRADNHDYLAIPSGVVLPEPKPWPEFSTSAAPQGADNDDFSNGLDIGGPQVVGMGEAAPESAPKRKMRGRAFSAGSKKSSGGLNESRGREDVVNQAIKASKRDRETMEGKAADVLKATLASPKLQNSSTGCGAGVGGIAGVEIITSNQSCVAPVGDIPSWWEIGNCNADSHLQELSYFEGESWVLIRLEDGRFVGSCAMSGFLTDCFANEAGCQSMFFRMNDMISNPWEGAEEVLTQMHTGSLQSNAALEVAVRMRHMKHKDPMMGVLSAYLYSTLGDIDTIRKMASFYVRRNQAIPYDIALLGMLRCDHRDDGKIVATIPATERREPITPLEKDHSSYFQATDDCEVEVAGRFPILSQGWAFIDDAEATVLVPEGLAAIGKEVGSAPFTTLSEKGGELLIDLLTR